ncbi:di-heme oxidoredictase family protein, partial [uncultured Muribaculum sp.]
MNRLFIIKSISALVVALALMSCDDEGLDVLDIEVPEGYALSAGTSTIFMNSSKAYDSEAEWVTGALASRFTRGDRLYDDMRTSSNDYGGGLGPVYAGYSCGSCHGNAGRTKPALWSDGGSGPYGFSAMLVYVTRKNGAFFKDYGRVIHDQAIYGVSAEGKLKVEWRYESGSFPDGETYELACP